MPKELANREQKFKKRALLKEVEVGILSLSSLFRRSSQAQTQTGLPDVIRNAQAVESCVQFEQISLFRVNADDHRRRAGVYCFLHRVPFS